MFLVSLEAAIKNKIKNKMNAGDTRSHMWVVLGLLITWLHPGMLMLARPNKVLANHVALISGPMLIWAIIFIIIIALL